jgi:hypothetical protein
VGNEGKTRTQFRLSSADLVSSVTTHEPLP